MSITTKTGDNGSTRLYSGETVDKSAPQPDACGDIDELVSLLSLARMYCSRPGDGDEILHIQRTLFVIGSEIATHPSKLERLKQRIDGACVKTIEQLVSDRESAVALPKAFIVPGSTLAAATIHHARAVTRRCERKIVALHRTRLMNNRYVIIWLNRLSDYLYLLALAYETSQIPASDPI